MRELEARLKESETRLREAGKVNERLGQEATRREILLKRTQLKLQALPQVTILHTLIKKKNKYSSYVRKFVLTLFILLTHILFYFKLSYTNRMKAAFRYHNMFSRSHKMFFLSGGGDFVTEEVYKL